jgi:hypothetical protein
LLLLSGLFTQPATVNNSFASPTNWCGCQALTSHKFNKAKGIVNNNFGFLDLNKTSSKLKEGFLMAKSGSGIMVSLDLSLSLPLKHMVVVKAQ